MNKLKLILYQRSIQIKDLATLCQLTPAHMSKKITNNDYFKLNEIKIILNVLKLSFEEVFCNENENEKE